MRGRYQRFWILGIILASMSLFCLDSNFRRMKYSSRSEKDRTLMGERLWDLMRCVDLLLSLEDKVDRGRIGCTGLSLGGEMAMWLGAMDSRVSHEIHLPSLMKFFHKYLTMRNGPMKFEENKEKGVLTVRDGEADVLTYRFGDQIKEGVDPQQTRSCYIHPLYSLDGQVLTDDFPKDHLHHHGVFWTWPIVKTRDQLTQTWHPHSPSLRQHFIRWLKREKKNDGTIISVENVWKLEEREVVAEEIVTVHIHPADNTSRTIDLELKIQAVGGSLTLQGTPEQNKGYGGLSIRGAPMFTGASMSTDRGILEEDSTNVPFRWADLSTDDHGVAIFVSPDHPDFPITWLLRNSYAGFINASWPGLEPAVIQPNESIILRYRIYIHKGNIISGGVHEAYKQYLSLFPKK